MVHAVFTGLRQLSKEGVEWEEETFLGWYGGRRCTETQRDEHFPVRDGWTAEPVAGVRPSMMWTAQRNTVQRAWCLLGYD